MNPIHELVLALLSGGAYTVIAVLFEWFDIPPLRDEPTREKVPDIGITIAGGIAFSLLMAFGFLRLIT